MTAAMVEQRKFGDTGLSVSVIGLGAGQIGLHDADLSLPDARRVGKNV